MEKDKYMKESVVFSKLAAFLTPTDVIRVRIMLAQIPAEDVVEIVRCRDCKYWGVERGFKETDPPRLNPQPDGKVFAECIHGPVEIGDSMYTDGDFFCAFGERKS